MLNIIVGLFNIKYINSECLWMQCLDHRSTTSHSCIGKEENTDNAASIGDTCRNTCNVAKCSFDDCNVRELLPVNCEFCAGMFCLRHRHQQDHLCRNQETVLNSSVVKNERLQVPISKKEKIGRGGVKSHGRAAKVALMKMKLHASGESSTPQVERRYFSIILPAETSETSKPMFFSKKWTIGRVIDQIAKECKLKNQNNQQLSKKLRLFDGFTKTRLTLGNILETEMNENPETLINGSELILEYIDEG